MNDTFPSTKVKPWHLDRRAVVYVCQSTPQQVHDHQEPTARQYALADRTAGLGRDESRPGGLAQRSGVPPDTVRRWLRVGWVMARRDEQDHYVIWADASELRRLRELRRLPRTWATKERLAELTKPKPRPER